MPTDADSSPRARILFAAVCLVLACLPGLLRLTTDGVLTTWLLREDGLYESLGAVFCLSASLILLHAAWLSWHCNAPARLLRSLLLGGWGALLLLMFAEEISWGQRLLEFRTPTWLKASNDAGEFNVHNLAIFQSDLATNHLQSAWIVLMFFWLIVLPASAAASKRFRQWAARLQLPIPSGPLALLLAVSFSLLMLLASQFPELNEGQAGQEGFELIELVVEFVLLGWAWQEHGRSRTLNQSDSTSSALRWLLAFTATAVLVVLGFQARYLNPATIRSQALTMEGNYLGDSGDVESAANRWSEAVQLWPDNIAAWFALAQFHLQHQHAADSLRAFQQVLDRRPNHIEATWGLSLANQLAGRMDEARAQLERTATLAPHDPEVQFQLGLLLVRLGDSERGMACLQEALRLDPTHRGARITCARLLHRQGKSDQALRELESALQLTPNEPELLSAQAEIELQTGQHDAAQTTLRRALEFAPHDLALRLSLAQAELAASELAQAEDQLAGLVAEHSAHPEVQFLSGVLRMRQGRPEEAVKHFSIAAEQLPNSADIQFNLALAHEARKQFGLATTHFERALQLRPTFSEAQQGLARVVREPGQSDTNHPKGGEGDLSAP
jgi:tetratricopeptide (TPR) repeat protein